MNNKIKILSFIVLLVSIALGIGYFFGYDIGFEKSIKNLKEDKIVSTFEECVSAGNPVMESYPRKCSHKGETFVENIGNELEKRDVIRITSPRPNEVISSPLEVIGEARGTWYFEAIFPIVLTNWDGLIIAEHYAEAQSEWMTEDFVPFKATLEFDKPEYGSRGSLILKKDNPSGLPEHDDALEIPILFE